MSLGGTPTGYPFGRLPQWRDLAGPRSTRKGGPPRFAVHPDESQGNNVTILMKNRNEGGRTVCGMVWLDGRLVVSEDVAPPDKEAGIPRSKKYAQFHWSNRSVSVHAQAPALGLVTTRNISTFYAEENWIDVDIGDGRIEITHDDEDPRWDV